MKFTKVVIPAVFSRVPWLGTLAVKAVGPEALHWGTMLTVNKSHSISIATSIPGIATLASVLPRQVSSFPMCVARHRVNERIGLQVWGQFKLHAVSDLSRNASWNRVHTVDPHEPVIGSALFVPGPF